MIKLIGKYNLDLGLDFAQTLDNNIEYGVYNTKPSIFVGFNLNSDELNTLELVDRKYIEESEFDIYVNRELTEEEAKLEVGLEYIKRNFPKDIYSNLRIDLASNLNKETIGNSKILSTYKIKDKDYTIYNSYKVKEKALVKESM